MLFVAYNRLGIRVQRAKMPNTGQTEQQISKELLLMEIELMRKQIEMSRVPVSSALQMSVAYVS